MAHVAYMVYMECWKPNLIVHDASHHVHIHHITVIYMVGINIDFKV